MDTSHTHNYFVAATGTGKMRPFIREVIHGNVIGPRPVSLAFLCECRNGSKHGNGDGDSSLSEQRNHSHHF